MISAVSQAIRIISEGKHDPQRAHERIKDFYHWDDVAERVEKVYEKVLNTEPYDFWTRLRRYLDRFS